VARSFSRGAAHGSLAGSSAGIRKGDVVKGFYFLSELADPGLSINTRVD
jgi:hypothetical protein